MSFKLPNLLLRQHNVLLRIVTSKGFFPCPRQRCLSKPNLLFDITSTHTFSSCPQNSSSGRQLSVLFYGSDDFSLESLRLLKGKLKLAEEDRSNVIKQGNNSKVAIKRLEVVTTSANNQIYNYCKKTCIPCHFFDGFSVPANEFDLGVVSSFGRLIPRQAIEACLYGILNIHGSLLPRWRGASPIQHAILANDTVTGLTIMRIKPKRFDVGQIVAQRQIEILHRLTAVNLKRMMAPLGAHLLIEVLENLDSYLASAREQPEEGVTLAPKLREADGELVWSLMDATEIDRRCRGLTGCVDIFTHWIDGTQLRLGDVVDPDLVARLDLDQLSGCAQSGEHLPGLLVYHKKRHFLAIASANGTWSAFRSFTLKGRKKMSALGFYNTFIRPLAKAYGQAAGGQKPAFILGRAHLPSTSHAASPHFVTVHNFVQLEDRISTQLKV